MKISIVTISFNQARYLRECIESVLAQNHSDLEYIVVDPGSTDGSRDIIKKYQDRIQKIILEPDKGPADGLKKGFACATGDIFYYLNADDVLEKDSLSKVDRIFADNKLFDVILGRAYQINEHGAITRMLFPSKKWDIYRYKMGVANAIQQATFFRASAYHAAGGFNVENMTCWDSELLVDMVTSGARVLTVKIVLGSFRLYSDSISGSGRMVEAYDQEQGRIRDKILSRGHSSRSWMPVWLIYFSDLGGDPARLIHNSWHLGNRAIKSLLKQK